MRFNDQAYLDDYVRQRRYPKIHDAIFGVILEQLDDGPTLDLCSSTGLLGRRIANILGNDVCAFDGDLDAVARGKRAGVYGDDLPILTGKLSEDNVNILFDHMREHKVTNVIARRCLCDMSDVMPLAVLRDGWADLGVTTIILEGRTQSVNSVHPYGHADRQAEAFAPVFSTASPARGHVRHLTR